MIVVVRKEMLEKSWKIDIFRYVEKQQMFKNSKMDQVSLTFIPYQNNKVEISLK